MKLTEVSVAGLNSFILEVRLLVCIGRMKSSPYYNYFIRPVDEQSL